MNTSHTPGPWMFRHYEWGTEISDDFGIFQDDGIGSGRHLADVAKIYQGERQPEVEQANARLIAAAPELLEALQTLVQMTGNAGQLERFLDTTARAVIAKATNTIL